jgi:hypothetical protein
MSCRKFRTMMELSREGELTAAEAHMLAEHVSACPSCAKEQESLEEMGALMSRLRGMALQPPAPEEFTRRILRRVAASRPPVRSARETPVLDRLFRVSVAPGFRWASASFIVLVIGLFLSQYFSMLHDIQSLEAQQYYRATAHAVPQVGYAVDTRPLRGTPDGALLDRLDGHSYEESIVVPESRFESLRESAMSSVTILSRNPLSATDKEAAFRLVFYLKTTARPTLCFIMEGV